MSRIPIPLAVSDTSTFAKSLRAMLASHEGLPSHLEMLNMLAKAAGYGNFQALRAADEPHADLAPEPTPSPPLAETVDQKLVDRVVRCFDEQLRLLRWPSRRTDQVLVLWILWSQMPSRSDLSEREVNGLLQGKHLFGDHALLRRELFDIGLVNRTRDGRIYRRVEQAVPANVEAALHRLASR